MMTRFLGSLLLSGAVMVTSDAAAAECDTPQPEWLFCEDFEHGALGWQDWFAASPFVECNGCQDGVNNPDRLRLSNDPAHAHDGTWGLFMPAEAAAGYRGASLTWRHCQGEKRQNCNLIGHDQLYYRAFVKLAPDHSYVHHFMSIGGTQADGFWDSEGNAGCRPNGERAAGTTVDFNGDHELFFYTYTPDMRCDSGGYCSGEYAQNICNGCAQKEMPCENGLECCWGNHYGQMNPTVLPRDRWVCLEMMMKLNTPGASDGEMAYWVDGQLGHHETGLYWRDVAALQLNKIWVQHYIDSGDANQPNRIAWDNIVGSTQRIGCGEPPAALDGGAVGPSSGGRPSSSSSSGAGPASSTATSGNGGGAGSGNGCSNCTAATVDGSLLALLGLLLRRRRLTPHRPR